MESEPKLVERLGLWIVGAFAFWLAELVGALAPSDSEPPAALAAALALNLALGLAAGLVWQVIRRLPVAGRLDERVLSFLPGAVLLAPKAVQALGSGQTVKCALWLGAAAAVALAVLALARRGEKPGTALGRLFRHAAVSLAIWLPAFRLKDVARLAETHSPETVIGPGTAILLSAWATLAALLVLAGPRLGLPRKPASFAAGTLLAGLVAWRLLAPPPYDLGMSPAAERLGRGTPVILIVLDTTRADHLSVYGYPRRTSPQLERFAEDAVVYEHAVSTSSWTLPAHASLFTGLLPLSHGALRLPGLQDEEEDLASRGIHRPAYPLPEDVPTFAEHLRSFDFQTAAVVANYAYLDPAFGISRGYQTYFSLRNAPVEPRVLHLLDRRVQALPWARRHWQVYRSAAQINRLAVDWLAAQENHRFFLFLNYMEPHLPWGPHQPGLRYEEFAAEASLPDRPGGIPAPEESWRRRVDLYDSNIASLDHHLGQLFDRLREMKLYDRSLIVVTSDHGESFGENGADGHGKSLNEAEVWVPLLIKYPEGRGAGRRSERVHLVDLMPTLAAELGRPFDGLLEGRVLAGPSGEADDPKADDSLLDPSEATEPRWRRLAEMYGDPTDTTGAFEGYQVAFYDGERKLLVRDDGKMLYFEAATGFETPVPIPAELQSWAAAQGEELVERRRLMEQRARSRQSELELDPEIQKSLEALGYV